MVWRRHFLAATLALIALIALATGRADAQDRVNVVASFSILADLVRNVGGERVELATLVAPNNDAHSYVPSPADAAKLAAARIVVINGLGFEGSLERFIAASVKGARVVVATSGIAARGEGGRADPHAWQSVANAKTYVVSIRDALAAVDPAGKAAFVANARDYLERLDALDAEIRAALAAIPPARRKIITTHDAFGYFGAAYGVEFIAPQGLSTEADASARDIARIIAQIKRESIRAVFLDNVADARLIERISREAGARIGGTLYSDALTGAAGPAPSYIAMMRHNLREIVAALKD